MRVIKIVLALGLFGAFFGCGEEERQVVVPQDVADELIGAESVESELDMEEEAEGEPTLGAGSSGRGH